MREAWHRNREGLGTNILSTVICAAATFMFYLGYRYVQNHGWCEWLYVTSCVLLGAALVAYLFVPRRRHPEPLPPMGEADVFPLSPESRLLLRAMLANELATVVRTRSYGLLGNKYDAGAVPVCDGRNVAESARFDSAIEELKSADYIRPKNSAVFTLTAKGIERARDLPPEDKQAASTEEPPRPKRAGFFFHTGGRVDRGER